MRGKVVIIAFLRGKYPDISISNQQRYILDYAQEMGIAIDMSELDDASITASLEEREHFLEMVRSLKSGDEVVVYELKCLSTKVDELAKIFDCAFKHHISLHICKERILIDQETTAPFLMSILSNLRESNRKLASSRGRPKGSFSKSKFDAYKQEIVKMLEDGISVNKMSKELGVSRSSLKDYINSRGLKEIVSMQKGGTIQNRAELNRMDYTKECPLRIKST